MPEKPVMHGRDHRPGGMDPLPWDSILPSASTATYARFTKLFSSVAANTATVFDLSTAGGVATNDNATGVTPGSSWSGTYFGFNTSSPDVVGIKEKGVYVYHATIWIGAGSTFPISKFSALILETGSNFTEGGASTPVMTQHYFDPGFAFSPTLPQDNLALDRTKVYCLSTTATRGMTFAHNSPDGAQNIEAEMFVVRIADMP